MRMASVLAILLSLALTMIGGATSTDSIARSYIVAAVDNRLPDDLEVQVAEADGILTGRIPQIGIAIAESDSPDFPGSLAASPTIRSVVPNAYLAWSGNEGQEAFISFEEAAAAQEFAQEQDQLVPAQWALQVVGAFDAWEAGERGAGARVAVIDTGIAMHHPDIIANLNTDLSRSFVPGEEFWHEHPISHGTAVSGLIAAADNSNDPLYPRVGITGVAPDAEIVMVKVFSAFGPGAGWPGWWSAVLQGIVYSADIDADVVNMSLGATRRKSGFYDEHGVWIGAHDVAELHNALRRATTYAHDRGVTIIAAAGNSALNLDQMKDRVVFPAEAPHVISVSATSPRGWAVLPAPDMDEPASYTNFGLSAITVAAPGGDWDYRLEDPWSTCHVPPFLLPCWAFDMVLSPHRSGWTFVMGTSLAAPHAAGVAAIIIGANGGSMPPAEVEAQLRRWADDLGKPGKDRYYGHGRVSAGNAFR